MTHQFITRDGYQVEIWVYNSGDYSANVFVAKSNEKPVSSGNCTKYYMQGRDAYEVLLSEGKHMSKEEVVRMFF